MILVVKNAPNEGPGTIADFFSSIKIIELSKGDTLPNNFDKIELVFIMGGPMSVYDEKIFPFLTDEISFIQNIVKNEIPMIGICLGAQLLAKAFSANVYKAPKEEIGFYSVNLTSAGLKDPLFYNLPETFEVFQWHSDTFDLPKDGELLAFGNVVKNQAFKIGKNAYGLQFHIEVDQKIISEWFNNKNEYIIEEKIKKLVENAEKSYNNISTFIL